tara:strand:+ start:120324 stop:122168 length:1845 start_codon:yes stop_codon:yes gene_type:complete
MLQDADPVETSIGATHQVKSKPRLQISIRWLVFASLVFASVLPIYVLYAWTEHNELQKEIAYVDENHLIIARNLATALERYANDVATVFELTSDSLRASELLDFRKTLADFDLRIVALVTPDDKVLKEVRGATNATALDLSSRQLTDLRVLAATDPGETIFSGLQTFDGTPHLFVVRSLPDDLLAVSVLAPSYLIELQQSIKFGERGHSMMVDQNGLVIAHPNAEWQASSKDAGKLSVVQQMLAGETGVATFYSPPMQADMIAGFTFVERTGWGVMVPQPMSELVARAKASEGTTFSIVLFEITLLVLLSWWLSHLISTPIRNVVATAKGVSAGDLNARVALRDTPIAISEARLLGASFNQVLSDLQSERNRLSVALDAAHEGSRAKSRFLSVMSHEIRTPMHGLMGVLELIEDGKLDEDQRQLVTIVQNAARNMASLLDSVLNYVSLEKNIKSGEEITFNPAEIAQGTVDLFMPLALQKGLSLTSSVSDRMLLGDPQMINQILLNLVGNAVKFTNEGHIHIASELRDDSKGAKRLVLSVTDSGIGIAQNLHATIFEEFSQVDSDLTRANDGTGLGLAISSRIAAFMKGKITLSSEPGKGSCFQLNIPVAVAEV